MGRKPEILFMQGCSALKEAEREDETVEVGEDTRLPKKFKFSR